MVSVKLQKKFNTPEKKIHFENPAVAEVFSSYSETIREKLLALRQLIFETASQIEAVGELEETLKWGEPSYVTTSSKSGSTIRIHTVRGEAEKYAMYFNCKTSLIDSFRKKFPTKFKFNGNRALVFAAKENLPIKELTDCIKSALTYHLKK